MCRKNCLLGIIPLLLVLVLSACGDKGGGVPPTMVESMTVKTATLSLRTELSGRVSAFYVSDVRPQVGGIIQERFFEEGSMVKEGEVLYQIDPALYEADYQNAKANLAHAKATAKVAELLAKRYAQLVGVKAVSQQEYDNAHADYLRALAAVTSAEAAVDSAKINLDYTKVTAPVSGRIGRSSVTKGALVTANQPAPLALIQQVDSMYVDVTQSSFEAMRLRKMIEEDNLASVQLIFQDGSFFAQNGTPIEGRLEFVDITVDQTTDMVNIRFVFPNDANNTLLPGMYVTVRVTEKPIENAILVPQKTIERDAYGKYLARILRAPTAEELSAGRETYGELADKMQVVDVRPITVNRTIGVNQYYVSDGLSVGETMLYSGIQKTTQGVMVLATSVDEQAPAESAETAETGTSGPAADSGTSAEAGALAESGASGESGESEAR